MENKIEELKNLATQYEHLINKDKLLVSSKIVKKGFIAQNDTVNKKDELIELIINKIQEL